MKVSNLIQPPSLVSQLEGKANEALTKRVEETNQKVLEKSKNQKNEISDEERAQGLIDLLI